MWFNTESFFPIFCLVLAWGVGWACIRCAKSGLDEQAALRVNAVMRAVDHIGCDRSLIKGEIMACEPEILSSERRTYFGVMFLTLVFAGVIYLRCFSILQSPMGYIEYVFFALFLFEVFYAHYLTLPLLFKSSFNQVPGLLAYAIEELKE